MPPSERAAADFEVARLIHNLRVEAGLSQKALAERIGTKQSVISRLEDADYDGHSLAMLRRVATALNRRAEVRFVEAESPGSQAEAGNQLSPDGVGSAD